MLKRNSAFLLLVVFLLINIIFTKNFFTTSTLQNIIIQTCSVILTGMGMTMVISTGGIDISVGAVMAMGATVSALCLDWGLIPAILFALVICSLFGLLAGFMVGKLRVQAMVVTLALLIGVRGVARVLTGSKMVFISGDNAAAYGALGSAKLFGQIPVQIIPMIIIVAIVWFILEKTVLGRHIQAVGDNPKSAHLAGINATKTLLFVYTTSAVLAGFAGILAAAKNNTADASALGLLTELDAIAAVAVGGTSMSGGKARIFGTVVGAITMVLILVTVNMNNISYEYAQVLKALIIILAVYIQRDQKS